MFPKSQGWEYTDESITADHEQWISNTWSQRFLTNTDSIFFILTNLNWYLNIKSLISRAYLSTYVKVVLSAIITAKFKNERLINKIKTTDCDVLLFFFFSSFQWRPTFQLILCQCISARGSICQHHRDLCALSCWGCAACLVAVVSGYRRGDLRCPRHPSRSPQWNPPDL